MHLGRRHGARQRPINVPGGKAEVEGIVGVEYGGDVEDDNSGVLEYLRIEFSGILLSQDNEVNGLTLAGVGSRTTVDHVMVHHTLDDCFEFFGGTVNAKHLLCAQNGDDGFDWDLGYVGKLQFLALQQDPTVADDTNGFEGDNDADGSENTPVSEPTIYNATLCGKNKEVDKQQYGMLLRRGTKAHIFNTIVTGFEAGLDLRNDGTEVELASSIISGNVNAEANIATSSEATSSEVTSGEAAPSASAHGRSGRTGSASVQMTKAGAPAGLHRLERRCSARGAQRTRGVNPDTWPRCSPQTPRASGLSLNDTLPHTSQRQRCAR